MPNVETKQLFCRKCSDYRLAMRSGTNHIAHLIMSILTAGFWLIIWLLAAVKIGGWRCSTCGSKKMEIL